MTKLSTTAWIAHNLGLATSIGGSLFGQGAFQPALRHNVDDQSQRAKISDEAWSRFSIWNLAAHGIVAATWFAGRTFLSGREVNRRARKLTRTKDVLVAASVLTGVSSVIIGKMLGRRAKAQGQTAEVDQLRTAVKVASAANVVTNAALGAVTTGLAMQGNKSVAFSVFSRLLP